MLERNNVVNGTYQKHSKPNHGIDIISCKCRQLRVTYEMPAIAMYANGSGNKSNVPIIDDHLPVTISTVNTKLIFTIDIDTKPKAKRSIM